MNYNKMLCPLCKTDNITSNVKVVSKTDNMYLSAKNTTYSVGSNTTEEHIIEIFCQDCGVNFFGKGDTSEEAAQSLTYAGSRYSKLQEDLGKARFQRDLLIEHFSTGVAGRIGGNCERCPCKYMDCSNSTNCAEKIIDWIEIRSSESLETWSLRMQRHGIGRKL